MAPDIPARIEGVIFFMKHKLFRWIVLNIYKVKEAEIMPKSALVIHNILFPLHWFYCQQSNIKYDPRTDIYTIRGMKFTGAVFEVLRDESKKGSCFELLEAGETCTIKMLPESTVTELLVPIGKNQN